VSDGRCEKHDNWHAHCQQCCREEARTLRARVAELEALRDALYHELADATSACDFHLAEVARLRALLMQWRGALVKWAPTRAEATAVLAGAPPLDSDGHCTTCGLAPEEGVTPECPPGFAAPAPLSERERATKGALEERARAVHGHLHCGEIRFEACDEPGCVHARAALAPYAEVE